ncbi:hypothetical protein, partial [Segatella hominis]|uniref:hypothetical protein n=1 Tax=Segatella hominis TaxID=2518605 RepID=UPI003AB8A3BC
DLLMFFSTFFCVFWYIHQILIRFLKQPIHIFTIFAKEDKSIRQSESCLSLRPFAISSPKS